MTFIQLTRLNILSSATRRTRIICSQLKMSSMASEDEVILEKKGSKGIITLNRPKALNALNLSMVRKMYPKLKEWEEDPKSTMVIIKGAGEKAFCAGGDIKAVIDAGSKGEPNAGSFFREEYILNNAIGTLHIPYIALIDGITMGGGVGLSVHGSFRVATERTLFAMPETGIGLFPDVGGGYFMPRLGGRLGIFLSLTGMRLKARDVYKAGVATHFVESEKIPQLEEELLALHNPVEKDIASVLDRYHKECQLGREKGFSLKADLDRIDKLFGGNTLEQIFKDLEKDGSEWADKQLQILKHKSPTSMKVTLRQLIEGADLSLQDCLMMEYRIAEGCLRGHDFYEGVRALLVDKDNNPKWNPKTIEEVTDEMVESHFRQLDNDLILWPDVLERKFEP
ncbi:3-hydroxyisobutyryl-CoA hydrolase, mitochondrial-like [Antedon mediterranea]|uniref:3-hydroxyisobutyryl-CoA hydrolase, mitochondrial-like n=1 Tax=Antedon mediterranea TaxID=105859 RepID=UPI003AF99D02